MIHGAASVPPIVALLYVCRACQETIGPKFVQVIVLSEVVPPGVWFHGGCPLALEPVCTVFVPLALTDWSWNTSPVVVSYTNPIVEKSVVAIHPLDALPLSVMVIVGATVGAGIPNP